MAEDRPITPEKQLLSLIETNRQKAPDVQARAVKHHSMSLFSPGAWMGRVSFFKDNFRKWFGGGLYQLDIKVINRLLMAVIIMLTLYLGSTLYFSIFALTNTPRMKLTAQEARDQITGIQNFSVLKNAVSYYLEKVQQRDIFKIGAAPPPQQKAGGPKEPTPKIVEATQNLKLVGISWSKNPDAMIEDTAALRTFFVKRGQTIGRVKIEAIFKDKVVLSYEGEETELR